MYLSFSPRGFLIAFMAACGVLFVTVAQLKEKREMVEINTPEFWAECGSEEEVWMRGIVRRVPQDGANAECVAADNLICRNFAPSYFKLTDEDKSGVVKIDEETELISLPLEIGAEVLIKGSCLKQDERKVILASEIVKASEESRLDKPAEVVLFSGIVLIVLASSMHLLGRKE